MSVWDKDVGAGGRLRLVVPKEIGWLGGDGRGHGVGVYCATSYDGRC